MSTNAPIILPPEGDYSLKAACLPFFRAIRSIESVVHDLLNEVTEAWEESKPKEVDHA